MAQCCDSLRCDSVCQALTSYWPRGSADWLLVSHWLPPVAGLLTRLLWGGKGGGSLTEANTTLRFTLLYCICAAPCCTAVYCTMLYCIVLHCSALHCTALHCIVLCSSALHCVVHLNTALYCAALYCAPLHCTVLCCTLLCTSTLHCAVLHSAALHCVVQVEMSLFQHW